MMIDPLRTQLVAIVLLFMLGATGVGFNLAAQNQPPADAHTSKETAQKETLMQAHYLEIVTPDVDATCTALAKIHDVTFGEPDAALGNARTAELTGGGRLGVRAPLRESEEPVVRPYMLVDDINAAVEAAKQAGAEIALPPMELPGEGQCAIYILGGIEHGLWQR